jgi:hypothetical protein
MKTVLMSLVVLASLNAFGAVSTLNYNVSEPYIVPSQYGVEAADLAFCPKIDALTVQQDEQLNGVALTMTQQRGILQTTATGSSHGCMSDILCPTDDNFDFLTLPGSASLTRNNDGNYPTTDLPGYSSLSISLKERATTIGHVYCYYNLAPAK